MGRGVSQQTYDILMGRGVSQQTYDILMGRGVSNVYKEYIEIKCANIYIAK
jgi:hypothetical protein